MKKNRDLDVGSWPDIVRKMYLTMKICICLLILGLSTVSARTHSQTRFSLEAKNKTLPEIFQEITRLSGYEFMYSSNEPRHAGKELTLTGIVTDKGGMPLPGVTILLKGTQLGVVTGADGHFQLTLPENMEHILVFSFVGMKTKEIKVNDAKSLTVIMEEDATEMDEVVVTGIFKKAKESYTGAVTSVSKEDLKVYKHGGGQSERK